MLSTSHSSFFRNHFITVLALIQWAACPLTFSTQDGLTSGDTDTYYTNVNLAPKSSTFPHFSFSKKYFTKQIGRELNQKENALLQITTGGKWKHFSDDFISFDLPDNPLLKIEVITPKSSKKPTPIPIVGSALKTANAPAFRIYKITFSNGLPYTSIWMSKATWFDNSICLCGAISHKTFYEVSGNLQEFSFLENEAIKKIQTINAAHRAVLFEWTHSPITQQAYKKIGSSIRLKPATKRQHPDWIALSKKNGFETSLGWIRLGITKEDMISYLGKPTKQSDSQLVYEQIDRWDTGGGDLTRYQFSFKNNQLTPIQAHWSMWKTLAPLRGSKDWIQHILRQWTEAQDEAEENETAPQKPPQKEVALLLEMFHKQSSTAKGDDWSYLCGIIADLRRLGIKDTEAAKLIKKRFSEHALPQHQARWVLELYDLPGKESLIRQRITFLLTDSKTTLPYIGEIHNLLASLDREEPKDVKLLRAAVKHSNLKIKTQAIYFASKLPKDEARIVITQALQNKNPDIRHKAYLLVDDIFSKKDIPWLNTILRKETVKHEAKYLKRKIMYIQNAEKR